MRAMGLTRFIVAAVVTSGVAAPAATTAAADRSANEITLAVIGDVPYGADQEASFGNLIDAVNDDPKVRTVVHVGDIKNGSTPCTDERFLSVRTAFDTFKDPVVYTPGDNEWTDCHRPAAGAYNPLERLATLREMFFTEPCRTLGRRTETVVAQPGYPENVRWTQSRVTLAALHVVGSDNGLAPWTGNFTPTPAQAAEVAARIAATVAWVDETFDEAERTGAVGVVLLMQADTFPTSTGQQDIVDRIAARTASFDGPVLVVQGDSHMYLVDQPLPLDNLTRIVVHGETLPFEYLRLTIDPRDADVFEWERVQVTEPAATG
jgi:Calcineurin-like phosphoesterase